MTLDVCHCDIAGREGSAIAEPWVASLACKIASCFRPCEQEQKIRAARNFY